MKIGDTLYHFDGNRRVRDKDGNAVYREHFVAMKITGETARSWIVGQFKVSKKDLSCPAACQYGGRGFFTKQGVEDDIWRSTHRYRIVRLVESASTDQLKLIADIVGYDPEEAEK